MTEHELLERIAADCRHNIQILEKRGDRLLKLKDQGFNVEYDIGYCDGQEAFDRDVLDQIERLWKENNYDYGRNITMTNEEAIFCLQQVSCGDCPKFYECRRECNNSKIYESNAMAIKSIAKQISMKPIEDGYYDIPCACPQCGAELSDKNNYCNICGQAIDWSIK